MPIVGPPYGTPEWYAYKVFVPEREHDIVFGASEAASLLGISPYVSPLELFCRKRQEVEQVDNLLMASGRALEPVILGEYVRQTSEELITGLPFYISDECPLLGATPDAINKPGTLLVEAKATSSKRYRIEGADHTEFGQDGTDQIPVDYLVQCQQQMYVMDIQRCDLAAMFDNRVVRIYHVDRDDRIIEALQKYAYDMAARIRENLPPDPQFGREGERRWIFESVEPGERIVLSEDVEEWWIRKCELDEKIKDMESEVEELKDRCVHAMSGAYVGAMPTLGKFLKRIDIKPTRISYERAAYSYIREVKNG